MTLTRAQRVNRLAAANLGSPSLKSLGTLLKLFETGSHRAAAEALGLSVPGLCQTILRLERQLGLIFLERCAEDGRKLVFTERGSELARFLAAWLPQFDATIDDLRAGELDALAITRDS